MVEFRILGPLEAVDGDRTLALGGAKQRTVLAVLLLHRREAVSLDRLIDALWGDSAPVSAVKSVQVYVSHLRKVLGAELVVTRGRGYVLAASADQVDADRFDALAADGREALEAGDPARASESLEAALALWRGPPLADFAYEEFAQNEARRLEEARLMALQDRIDADLALGGHAALIGELETFVSQHPLRERPRRQLALALYQSGRQVEALEGLREARRTLLDELGLEPGPEIGELESRILSHDPDLRAPARAAAAERRRARGAALLAGGGLVLVAAAIAAATIESDAQGVEVARNSVAVIDVADNEVVDDAPVGVDPGAIGAGEGSIWVANGADDTVSQIGAASRRLEATIAPGIAVSGMVVGEEGVWVADALRGKVAHIDPSLQRVDRSVALGRPPPFSSEAAPVATGSGVVWTGAARGSVARIDAKRATLEDSITVGNQPSSIAVGEGGVWVADDLDDTVTRLDPSTGGVITTIPVGPRPAGIAAGDGAVWVTQPFDDTVARIDPKTNSIADTIEVGVAPAGVTAGGGAVWVANSGDGTVSRIDPGSNAVSATIDVGGSPQASVVSGDALWVSVRAAPESAGSEIRDDVLRIYPDTRTGPGIPSTDPAQAPPSPISNATCALLLNYPDLPFPAGSELRPEVARSMPVVSDGGRTYTYRLRDGFRFSPPSDQPGHRRRVSPSDRAHPRPEDEFVRWRVHE